MPKQRVQLLFPVHPGAVLRDYMEHENFTARELARRLGVATTTVTNVIRKRNGVGPTFAVRLERLFGRPAHYWMALQAEFELAGVRRRSGDAIRLQVRPLRPATDA